MCTLRVVVSLTAVLAYFLALAHGAEIAYCSPDNTGADTGYQAGKENQSAKNFSKLTLVDQCTISISQMALASRTVKTHMPSPSSKT